MEIISKLVGRGTGVPVGCSHLPDSVRGEPKPGMETLPARTPHSIPFTCLARGRPQHPCPTLEERPGKCQFLGGLQKGRLLFPRRTWQPDVTGLGWGSPFLGRLGVGAWTPMTKIPPQRLSSRPNSRKGVGVGPEAGSEPGLHLGTPPPAPPSGEAAN